MKVNKNVVKSGQSKEQLKRGSNMTKQAAGAGKSVKDVRNMKKSVRSASGVSDPGSSVSQHDPRSSKSDTSKSVQGSKKKLVDSPATSDKSSKGVKRKGDQNILKTSISANDENTKAKKVKKQVINQILLIIKFCYKCVKFVQ